MSDKNLLAHITELVDKEHRLRTDVAAPDANATRLQQVAEQLDQCWDLLRQRRAKREFGEAAGDADLRGLKTVEGYTG